MVKTLQVGFAEIVTHELEQLARLESVLDQEYESLKQRDSDALESNTAEKQQLIAAIEKDGRERLALLQNTGHGTDRGAVLAFVQAEPKLRRMWDELRSVLLRCQHGMLIEMGRQQTQQLLSILLGEGERKNTELYDARGSTLSSFANSRSVKA